MELVIARNPDADSTLPYLIRVPVSGGLVFRTKGTWPRTSALFCYPVDATEWPAVPEVVERIVLRVCERRGAAIDVIAERARESRSQIVFTRARGRDMVFWQSPRTRKQARPNVSTPTARAAGVVDLEILVDAHERYAYRFPTQAVRLTKIGLRCGDYAIRGDDGQLLAAVERKSLPDLVSSLTSGRLRYAVAELAALPHAAVVVEDRYSAIFTLDRIRPAVVADGLAELQVRWPNVPIVFTETRKLAEEWTYRYLAAARTWGGDQPQPGDPDPTATDPPDHDAVPGAGPATSEPTTAKLRVWARAHGITVPDRGRLGPHVLAAWQQAQQPDQPRVAAPGAD